MAATKHADGSPVGRLRDQAWAKAEAVRVLKIARAWLLEVDYQASARQLDHIVLDLEAVSPGTGRDCPSCGVSRHIGNARCQLDHEEHC